MKNIKVMFLIPTGNSTVGYDCAASLFRTAEVLRENGIDSELLFLSGCPAIDRARDILIYHFLKTDATHLMQIDDDLGWDAEDIVRMAKHDVDYVCGVYCVKKDEPEFRVNFNNARHNGLIGVDGSPGGFQLMKRIVIERMIEKFPELEASGIPDLGGDKVFGFHTHTIMDGMFWGEDMSFSRRAMLAGSKMWIDPTINLRHWSGARKYDHKLIGNLVEAKAS